MIFRAIASVTLGIGALAERVEDGLTGIIAGSIREMGLATVQLLRDGDLWLAFHRRCLSSTQPDELVGLPGRLEKPFLPIETPRLDLMHSPR